MPALALKEVTVWFEGQTRPAVEEVSFELEEGRIAVLIGPNGSGKSTLLGAILKLVPYRGEVLVFDQPVEAVYREIGYVPQRLAIDPTLPLTTGEAIRMPLRGRGGAAGEAAFREVVETMGIGAVLNRPLGTLSGGQLKRALIARAMITRPRLLLLDEPEAGMDVEGEQTIYQLFDRLAGAGRLTALICSHELELVSRYAHEVLCLNRRLLGRGSPAQALTPEALARLYGPATAAYHHHHHLEHRHHGEHRHDAGGQTRGGDE